MNNKINEIDLKNLYANIKRLLLEKIKLEDQCKLDEAIIISDIIDFADTVDLCFLIESSVYKELKTYILFEEKEINRIWSNTLQHLLEVCQKKINR
jgi:hypothetical protein